MKKLITICFIIMVTLTVNAQNVPYEKLEELSTAISKLQFGANELNYNDGTTDYELSFPEENFQVSFDNKLATNAVYKKSGSNEFMELTENIDLSKVTSVTIISSENSVAQIRVKFPFNSIKTQILENGILIETKDVSSIDFFVNGESRKLYAEIIKLCHYLKKEKEIFSFDIEELATIWEAAINKNTIASLQSFHFKYLNTLYDEQAIIEIKQLEKAELREKNRLEAIRIEKERIRAAEEAERVRKENDRLARIANDEFVRSAILAEEIRLKEVRNVGFVAFRIGYVSPTNEESKKLSGIPPYISNGQPHNGNVYAPYSTPYTKGQFGLKSGFSAGFTGIAHLEFINKSMGSRIGFGFPMDINFAMMKYSWKDLAKYAGSNAFLYSDAKYGFWGVLSGGIGLSLSIRPAERFFIDLIARPDFYLTTGGKYKVEGTSGTKNYTIETSRYDNSFGIGKTLGINLRYKRVMLGFEMKQGIIDKEHFVENVKIEENNYTTNYQYPVTPSNLNLDYMQMTLGIVF